MKIAEVRIKDSISDVTIYPRNAFVIDMKDIIWIFVDLLYKKIKLYDKENFY